MTNILRLLEVGKFNRRIIVNNLTKIKTYRIMVYDTIIGKDY